MWRVAVLGVALGAMLAVAGLAGCPKRQRPWPWAQTRAELVRRSRVWLGDDVDRWAAHVRTLDPAAGPSAAAPVGREALVRCTHVPPPSDLLLGNTPKFVCRRTTDGAADDFTVKWGEENGEVYAEVAGTRLLWLLGFPADGVYPVRVECRDCPADPWRERSSRPGRTAVFQPATIERRFPGRTIEERPDQGWRWDELARVDPGVGGAPRAHRHALLLLAAFLQHRDNKPSNQRLVCPEADLDEAGTAAWRCRRPVMMVHDLGSVFGGPTLLGTEKMRVERWEAEPLWHDARRCVANLTAEHGADDGLERPRIAEEGRLFLARLLEALDDRQVARLFETARGDRRGGVARWVAAFDRKREAVRRPVPGEPAFRCP
jgi:hypothetical protein